MSDQKLLKEGNGEKKGYNNYIIIAVILIILLVIFFGGRDSLKTTEEENMPENENENSELTASTVSLTVLDQAAGFEVKVSSITVSQPLWVVVYEDAGGERGNILGARRVRSEDTTATIKLLRETEPERTYYVVLHKDDGDDIFDFKTTDTPFIGAGSEVVKTFNTITQ